MSTSKDEKAEERIQMWKVKQLIKKLTAAKGNGTSMISLIIPPKGQISLTQNMLQTEYGTASNIKSRVNRLSVLSAIVSTQQRLKLYSKVPPNGLVMYVVLHLSAIFVLLKLNNNIQVLRYCSHGRGKGKKSNDRL